MLFRGHWHGANANLSSNNHPAQSRIVFVAKAYLRQFCCSSSMLSAWRCNAQSIITAVWHRSCFLLKSSNVSIIPIIINVINNNSAVKEWYGYFAACCCHFSWHFWRLDGSRQKRQQAENGETDAVKLWSGGSDVFLGSFWKPRPSSKISFTCS